MNKVVLQNGLTLIHEKKEGIITSLCIGFDAGAGREKDFFGAAHALEHMIFKGSKNRSEYEINREFDNLFGFNNAMTNFPYVIYYGTSINENFKEALSLYMDILLNPVLSSCGFNEEMDVILQECKEWREDFDQHCEDLLYGNAFSNRRIKDIIIGNEESVKKISLEVLKQYYNEYYVPNNCVISIVTSLDYEEVYEQVVKFCDQWREKPLSIKVYDYEPNKNGIFINEVPGLEGAKVQYCMDIHDLNSIEMKALNIFNMMLGQGLSGILFDEIRTKRGLAYDLSTLVREEVGIKLFQIKVSTGKSNYKAVIQIIDEIFNNLECYKKLYEENYMNYIKRLKLKKFLEIEKSIELAKKLTTYEIMYKTAEKVYEEMNIDSTISWEILTSVIEKIWSSKSIQVII